MLNGSHRWRSPLKQPAGFSLVEMMVAIFISIITMTAVTVIYSTQTKSYTAHDEVAGIQQNLRGALAVVPMDIRSAGCNPREITPKPGFLAASDISLQFTRDIRGNSVNSNDGDGDVNDTDEIVTYSYAGDTNGDGIFDGGGANWSGIASLNRNGQPLANNIEALEFNYILDGGATTLNPPNLNAIRAVQVSILARVTEADSSFTQQNTYTSASGRNWTPPQDNFRRRFVITTIQCRNIGL